MSLAQANPPLTAQWKYWGAGFNVPPCSGPVNLEQLLIDTAKGLAGNPRLLAMAATWLTMHHEIVEVQQLARLAGKLRGRDSARLGLLLESAQEFIGADVFAPVLAACQRWEPPEPLFDVDRSTPGMARIAAQSGSPLSGKWGLWAQSIDRLKPDAMRPASWIAQYNPMFLLRRLLKGDVRSKVMTALAEQGFQDVSETDLTRRAGCTRRAMHLALENLEAAGLIVRRRQGRNYAISLCRPPKPIPSFHGRPSPRRQRPAPCPRQHPARSRAV
jgi:biotin operon repressor